MDLLPFRTLVVLHSYHHFNTAKIADAIAAVLGAHVVASHDMDPALPEKYDLVGFGSGIDSGKHYKELLDIADRLPESRNKRAFVFSTSSVFNGDKINEDHSTLRGLLQSKGYFVLGELSCKGFNTNGFLKLIGGMNRGRPNNEDLRHAREFAESLKRKMTR